MVKRQLISLLLLVVALSGCSASPVGVQTTGEITGYLDSTGKPITKQQYEKLNKGKTSKDVPEGAVCYRVKNSQETICAGG